MTDFEEEPIVSQIDEFYEKKRTEAPGVKPDDITQTIIGAREE